MYNVIQNFYTDLQYIQCKLRRICERSFYNDLDYNMLYQDS